MIPMRYPLSVLELNGVKKLARNRGSLTLARVGALSADPSVTSGREFDGTGRPSDGRLRSDAGGGDSDGPL